MMKVKRLLPIFTLSLTLLTTTAHAEVKVVGEQAYTGEVQQITQTINDRIPQKLQEAFNLYHGFVWVKPNSMGVTGTIDGATQLTGVTFKLEDHCNIEVDPSYNPQTTQRATMEQFGNFLNIYNGVTKDSSKDSIIASELAQYQALCQKLEYQIPEAYSTFSLFSEVFAARTLHDSMPYAGDILNTCPKTNSLIESELGNITTTVSLSVRTFSVSTNEATLFNPKTKEATPQEKPKPKSKTIGLPITWGE